MDMTEDKGFETASKICDAWGRYYEKEYPGAVYDPETGLLDYSNSPELMKRYGDRGDNRITMMIFAF